MFDKLKGLMDMQKKMGEIKKQLERATFDVSSDDGAIKITMNGAQQIQDVSVVSEKVDVNKLSRTIKDTVNKAIRKSHEIAADKMKEVSGLNIPGL